MSENQSPESVSVASAAVDAKAASTFDSVTKTQEALRMQDSMPTHLFDSVVKAQQAQLRILDSMPTHLFDSVVKAQEMQLGFLQNIPTELFNGITKMYETQLSVLAAMPQVNVEVVTDAYFSRISEALQVIKDSNPSWTGEEECKTQSKTLSSQKLGSREIAAWLTVISFLIIYISSIAAIRYDSTIARISSTDGPTPFEAAMAVGALVFWARMNRSGGSPDE